MQVLPPGGSLLPQGPANDADSVRQWLSLFNKAVRATRFYPETNATRAEQLRMATDSLCELLAKRRQLSLRVRQGALLLEKEPVLEDEDFNTGVPNILYRSSIFAITFIDGVTDEELLGFISALVKDYSESEGGEDLVTELWRLEPAHIQYTHVDVLAAAFRSAQTDDFNVEDEETKRIRRELEELVAELAQDGAGNDFRAMWDGYLETEAGAQQAAEAETQMLEGMRGALHQQVGSAVERFAISVEAANKLESLAGRTLQELVQSLIQGGQGEVEAMVDLLSRMVESLLQGGDFDASLSLVERLSQVTSASGGRLDVIDKIIARLSDEKHIATAVDRLENVDANERQKVLTFLQFLGPSVVAPLLAASAEIEEPEIVTAICKVIVSAARSDPGVLTRVAGSLSVGILCELLRQCDDLATEPKNALVWRGYEHENASVRATAVAAVGEHVTGYADALLGRAITDSDSEVRIAALALLEKRKRPESVPVLSRFLRLRNAEERDPKELELALMAYAKAGGEQVLSDLNRMLNHKEGTLAGRLSKMTKSISTPSFAARAIAEIGGEEATSLLNKGAKSLKPMLRKACKEGLEYLQSKPMFPPLEIKTKKTKEWSLGPPPAGVEVSRDLVSASHTTSKTGMSVIPSEENIDDLLSSFATGDVRVTAPPSTHDERAGASGLPPAPRSVTPAPRSVTPAPRSVTPAPRSVTPAPRSVTPAPRSVTPAPRSVTPAPRSSTPSHHAKTEIPSWLTAPAGAPSPAEEAPTEDLRSLAPDAASLPPPAALMRRRHSRALPIDDPAPPAARPPKPRDAPARPSEPAELPAEALQPLEPAPAAPAPAPAAPAPQPKPRAPSEESLDFGRVLDLFHKKDPKGGQ